MLVSACLSHFLPQEWRQEEWSPHHIPAGFSLVGSQVLHIGGKALVEPQVIPPAQRDQVTEPLEGRTEKTVRATRLQVTCCPVHMYVPSLPCEPAHGR